MSIEGAIAANRFGLGAGPGETEEASRDPKAWLMGQLREKVEPLRFAALPAGKELVNALMARQKARQAKDRDALKNFLAMARQNYLSEMTARFLHGADSQQAFRERLVRFWSNHFTVSIAKPQCAMFVGAFEREAIRPHVAGKFSDMLLAVERHPAMLLYLDNAQSIGPNSAAGKRTGKGLNENLGREILELHTVGADAGYTQADVIALAKILTGWSLDRTQGAMLGMMNAALGGAGDGAYRFYPLRHEPGPKVLLGKTYPAGYEGGVQALRDLAAHPATARHLARKLATHFIADDPPELSVKRIAATFVASDGDLGAVCEAIVTDPAAWRKDPVKVRTPVEYITAALRVGGRGRLAAMDEKAVRGLIASARAMGEMPFSAPGPNGWPDTAAAWTGSDAILERVEWANAAGERLIADGDPLQLADDALGPLLSAETRKAITRAASPAQGLALLFASPEFQRR